ncbi:MAG: InlB B-repeat-containing protein, partial [Clostridia bacterium]
MFCGLLSSCDEPKEVDTSNMYLVTYIGNGGLFEGARTMREIYYEKNSLINMPTLSMTGSEISISSMGKITRRGYNLAGWYTSEKVSYYADENGEYVKVDSYYERKNDGKFVLIYVRDDNGTYALKVSEKENADGVLERSEEYVLYNPTDKSLEGCERYEEKFVEYNKEYSDLLRYECVTENAYAIVTDMFMPRFDGKYIKNEDETYSFIGDKNYDGQRYTLSPYFVTSATDVISLDRYKAEFIYNEADRWDFNNTRMPEQNVVLYANWQPALTATYVYWDDSSFSVYSNTIGAPITKPTGTAKDGNGRTFIGWSREKDKYVPWNFESDVYPDNVEGNVLKLYAHYAQGDYIRITNADELKEIGKYPEQSFMLCNDINLEGTMGHPMGFTKNVLFTGTFEGNGFAISNFKITANNKLLEPAPFALFNQTKNAT